MHNELLEQHKYDPAWAEVMRLYSGLFDINDDREDFILNLAESNILLAATCKTCSTNEQKQLQINLVSKATSLLDLNNTSKINIQFAFLALSELERFDLISNYLLKIKGREILFIRNLFQELSPSNEAKQLLLMAVYSQPSLFILILLDLIERFERDNVSLNKKEINDVLKILINEKVKVKHTFAFICKFVNEIDYLNEYKDYAISALPEIEGFQNLMLWMRLFKINMNNLELIHSLSQSQSIKAHFNLLFLIEKVEEKSQLYILNKFLKSNSKLITTSFIYIKSKKKLEQNHFDQMLNYNVKIDFHLFNSFQNFEKSYSKIYSMVKSDKNLFKYDEEIHKTPEIGEIIQGRLISKTHNFNKQVTRSLNKLIIAEVINIIPSRVFVEIDDKRKASIYIGELSNKYVGNIFDFKYNGKTLHVGQKLIAKVIGIDKKSGINLSLKNVDNFEGGKK